MPRAVDRRTLFRAIAAAATGVIVAACSTDRDTVGGPPLGERGAGAAGGDGAGPAAAGGAVRSVAMIGDSITVGSQAELGAAFAAMGLTVDAIDAQEGRRIASGEGDRRSGVDAARSVAGASPPDLWVVALGTNDVGKYQAEQYPAVIGELLAVLPAGAPLVWVDVYLAEAFDRSAEFNSALNGALAGRQRAAVAAWSAVAGGDGVLADGVHPSEAGRTRFADVVTEAVATLTG